MSAKDIPTMRVHLVGDDTKTTVVINQEDFDGSQHVVQRISLEDNVLESLSNTDEEDADKAAAVVPKKPSKKRKVTQ